MTISDEEISRWRKTIDSGFCLSICGSAALLDEVVRLRQGDEMSRDCLCMIFRALQAVEPDGEDLSAVPPMLYDGSIKAIAAKLRRRAKTAEDEATHLRAENAELRKLLGQSVGEQITSVCGDLVDGDSIEIDWVLPENRNMSLAIDPSGHISFLASKDGKVEHSIEREFPAPCTEDAKEPRNG